MSDGNLGLILIGGQGIGVVAQRADRNALGCTEIVDAGRVLGAEAGHVDVGHAGVATLGLAHGPAHDLDTVEAFGRGKVEHLFQREVGQDGADKSKLHGVVPFYLLFSLVEHAHSELVVEF